MRSRKAIVLMDALVAVALIGVLLTVSLSTLASMASARRATENRAIAVQLAASAIERARGLPWEEITTERLDEMARSSDVRHVLPRAELKLTIEPATSGPPAKQIRALVTWNSTAGGPSAPVRIDYWAYGPRGESP